MLRLTKRAIRCLQFLLLILIYEFRPVNCEICGKQFGDKYLLTKHIQGTHEKSLIVQVRMTKRGPISSFFVIVLLG